MQKLSDIDKELYSDVKVGVCLTDEMLATWNTQDRDKQNWDLIGHITMLTPTGLAVDIQMRIWLTTEGKLELDLEDAWAQVQDRWPSEWFERDGHKTMSVQEVIFYEQFDKYQDKHLFVTFVGDREATLSKLAKLE